MDWVRGIAVLVMLEAHIVDAWTEPADRASTTFRNLTILGGFGAPLFLWLAGLSVVLAGEAAIRRGDSRRAAMRALCIRGLYVFLLAFLFRLQALIVTPGGSLVKLLRVDILNVMGPAMALAALLWGIARQRTGIAFIGGVVAAVIAFLTPLVRTAEAIDAWPALLQWYVRPSGSNTTFTMLPWAGFVFAGAAAGGLLTAPGSAEREPRVLAALGVAGALLVAVGAYTARLPQLFQGSSFWTSSPTYFAIRTGILMLTLTTAYVIARMLGDRTPILRPLERMGRSSLFIYWIHVELVYGYATQALHRSLPLRQVAVGYMVFSAAMYGLALLKEFLAKQWRNRRQGSDQASSAST